MAKTLEPGGTNVDAEDQAAGDPTMYVANTAGSGFTREWRGFCWGCLGCLPLPRALVGGEAEGFGAAASPCRRDGECFSRWQSTAMGAAGSLGCGR